jgi:hypothetical protein
MGVRKRAGLMFQGRDNSRLACRGTVLCRVLKQLSRCSRLRPPQDFDMLTRQPYQSVAWFEPLPLATPPLAMAVDNMVAACSLVPYDGKACMQASALVGDVLAMENARNKHMVAKNHMQVQRGFEAIRAAHASSTGAGSTAPATGMLARVSSLHLPAGAPAGTLTPEAVTIAALAQLGTTPVGDGTASLAAVACP